MNLFFCWWVIRLSHGRFRFPVFIDRSVQSRLVGFLWCNFEGHLWVCLVWLNLFMVPFQCFMIFVLDPFLVGPSRSTWKHPYSMHFFFPLAVLMVVDLTKLQVNKCIDVNSALSSAEPRQIMSQTWRLESVDFEGILPFNNLWKSTSGFHSGENHSYIKIHWTFPIRVDFRPWDLTIRGWCLFVAKKILRAVSYFINATRWAPSPVINEG